MKRAEEQAWWARGMPARTPIYIAGFVWNVIEWQSACYRALAWATGYSYCGTWEALYVAVVHCVFVRISSDY